VVEIAKRPIKERLSLPPIEENPARDGEMDSDFMDLEPELDIICNVVSILPAEYDVVSEVEESKDDFNPEGMEKYRPMCYYVTNYGCVDEQKTMFEKLDDSMKSHLKPLFIQAKVDGIGVNKVLVDGDVAVNLMPQSLLKKIGKLYTDLKPHNIVLSNYEGKAGHSLGAL